MIYLVFSPLSPSHLYLNHNMASDSREVYSSLEAVPVRDGPDGLQYYDPKADAKPEHHMNGNFPEVVPVRERNLWWRWRKWFIIGSGIALLVIIGAVVGGVVGSRSTHASSTQSAASPTPSGARPSSKAQPKRNIAAASFVQGGINNTRVYYQNDAGNLIEAAGSPNLSSITPTVLPFSPKLGSALAAAVSHTENGFPLVHYFYPRNRNKFYTDMNSCQEISVYYTDSSYTIHDIIWTSATSSWAAGTIAAEKYTTLSNGSITALYDQCPRCSNSTIVVFQDSNGYLQVANHTETGWTSPPTQLVIDATQGTGLALQAQIGLNVPDQINLYHQTSSLNLTLASYKNAETSSKRPL